MIADWVGQTRVSDELCSRVEDKRRLKRVRSAHLHHHRLPLLGYSRSGIYARRLIYTGLDTRYLAAQCGSFSHFQQARRAIDTMTTKEAKEEEEIIVYRFQSNPSVFDPVSHFKPPANRENRTDIPSHPLSQNWNACFEWQTSNTKSPRYRTTFSSMSGQQVLM